MRSTCFCLALLLGMCLHAQHAQSQGGFREVLEIVGIELTKLHAINPVQPTADDWSIIAQIVARLEQHTADLDRWIQKRKEFSADEVGELFDVEGIVERVDKFTAPDGVDPEQLYRCQFKFTDRRDAVVLAVKVPERWKLGAPLKEPVSLRGVLLRAEGTPLLLTNHVSWHPQDGLSAGQLLLVRFGMDAALWDEIVQRTAFVSPANGREANAFYACLAAIAKVPVAELATLTLESIADVAAAVKLDAGTKRERQIAAAVAEQAALGLSSVAPLFLNPRSQVGQLVRLEGTARRAVRIVAEDLSGGQPIREYYELDVFTADSQNLPIVCLVTRLPTGFPEGDAIRAGVRIDGVFFKLWRYHSRQIKEIAGETATQQASYTPVVMAATVTWLKQATTPEQWWGLAIGGIAFVLVIGGLLRMMFSPRARPRMLKDETPDFSKLRN
jgi:hypothetical protein